MGPVEYFIVEFPDHKFSGDIVPATIVRAALYSLLACRLLSQWMFLQAGLSPPRNEFTGWVFFINDT